jgi:alanyl-tRNA synthetase
MRRIEAVTGAAADALIDARIDELAQVAELVGSQTIEAVPERIAALQAELAEAKRRLRAGTPATPKPGDLAKQTADVAPGVRLLAYAGPFESIDAMKGVAKDLRDLVPSGVIALGLDADEPQVFVTVSDDLVGRGIAAGTLVQEAVKAIDGKGGGRPQMAQGKGTRREGLQAALEGLRATLANGANGSNGSGPTP